MGSNPIARSIFFALHHREDALVPDFPQRTRPDHGWRLAMLEHLGSDNTVFWIGASLFGLLLAGFAFLFGAVSTRWPAVCRRLPRERVVGAILGLLCLAWAAMHVWLMLEGGLTRYRPLLFVLVPTVGVLAFFHLDFLLTRALGGFLLLCVNALLHAGFVADIPARPIFSVACHAMALVGFALLTMPWRFRDMLDRCAVSRMWRRSLTGGFAALALLFAIYAVVA